MGWGPRRRTCVAAHCWSHLGLHVRFNFLISIPDLETLQLYVPQVCRWAVLTGMKVLSCSCVTFNPLMQQHLVTTRNMRWVLLREWGAFAERLPGRDGGREGSTVLPAYPMCLLVRMRSSSCCFYYFFYLGAIQIQGLARVTKTSGLGFSVGPLAWAPEGKH